jgi:hypothetical protein
MQSAKTVAKTKVVKATLIWTEPLNDSTKTARERVFQADVNQRCVAVWAAPVSRQITRPGCADYGVKVRRWVTDRPDEDSLRKR